MSKSKLRMIVLGIGMIFLTACAEKVSSCPPNFVYSRSFNDQLIAELAILPKGTALEHAISDYFTVRREIAKCRGEDIPR